MWRTSWAAVKLAWVAYIVPFLFIYSPAMLLRGNWIEVLLAVVTAFVGTTAVSMAIIGYATRPIGAVERILFAVFGIMLMIPPGTDIVTIVINLIGGGGLLVLLFASRTQRAAASPASTPLNKEEIA
jgi:TRAP-type uncharacterized transport system fused permease subunit